VYLNITVKVISGELTTHLGTGSIGIDLGLRAAATTSNGEVLIGRRYHEYEARLAKSQRANTKKKTRAIHAKIKNKRRDDLHKFSRQIVNQNSAVFVGDIKSKDLTKTKMAKSTYDAGWYSLKQMLKYKCAHAGIYYQEVNEAYTTQTCSSCGEIPTTSPKGRAGLRIREWTCSSCGTTHDRDVNAAKNILAAGHCRLAGGTSKRKRRGDVKPCLP
jgi:IS605 OrfB family transposase